MISRGPQPRFVGPTPSEAVTSAGSLAQKNAEMFMQGIQEGAKNYTAQQQVDAEKEKNKIEQQKEVSASEQLRIGLLAQTRQKGLLENGAMDYVENKDQWMEIYKYMAKGDPKLAEAMFEGGAKALQRISGIEALNAGIFGFSQEAQAGQVPQDQTQGQAQAPVAAPSPVAPMNPPAMVQQASPSASPTAQGPIGYASTPEPMPIYPAINPETGQVLPQAQQQSSSTAGRLQRAITQATKGLPDNAVTRTANSGLSKLADIAEGKIGAETSVTPKEQAAIKQVTKPTIVILRNAITKGYIEAGGSEEHLQQLAGEMNEAMKDPQFAAWVRNTKGLTKEETASLSNFMKSDLAERKLAEQIARNNDLKETAYFNAALRARSDQLKYQTMYESLQARKNVAKDAKEKTALIEADKAWQRADDMIKSFAAQGDTFRKDKISQGMNDEQVRDEINRTLADPSSGLSFTLKLAAEHFAAAQGIDKSEIPTIIASFKDDFIFNIPLPILRTREGGSVEVPDFGGATPPVKPGSPPPVRKLKPGAAVVPPGAGGAGNPAPAVNKGSNYANSLGF